MAAFAESEHSRLPVYQETLDDPVGVVHLKDVFKLLSGPAAERSAAGPVLPRMKRETLYVPPSMRAADLLLRMQATHIHMAMVIDEFGGVDGLVTLENIIEAVVGEIDDEHDEAAAIQITARAGGVFEVDARVDLEELEAALGQSLTTPRTWMRTSTPPRAWSAPWPDASPSAARSSPTRRAWISRSPTPIPAGSSACD